MIVMPDEVKEILKNDSVKKNLRISFPNGEREDIINKNIVSESMSFTESISSREELRFGLCEASVLEFETVGVENISGKTIDATLEIDVTNAEYPSRTLILEDGKNVFETVSALEKFEIEIDNVDATASFIDKSNPNNFLISSGIEDAENNKIVYTCFGTRESLIGHVVQVTVGLKNEESVVVRYAVGYYSNDLSYPYYPIPLGRFVVDRCPRSANLFDRRSVTAYGKSYDLNRVNSVERYKRNRVKNSTYTIDIPTYLLSVMGEDADLDFEKNDLETSETMEDIDVWLNAGTYLVAQVYYKSVDIVGVTDETLIKIPNKIRTNGIAEKAVEFASNMFDALVESGIVVVLSSKQRLIEFVNRRAYPFFARESLVIDDDTEYINPRLDETTTLATIAVPYKFDFLIIGNSFYKTFNIIEDSENIRIQQVNIPYPHYKVKYPQYDMSDIDFRELLISYAEMQGKFGRSNRYGKFVFESIKDNFGIFPIETLYPSEKLYPAEANGGVIEPSDQKSLWVGDYLTLPYGRITATYLMDNGETATATYNIPKETIYGNVSQITSYATTKTDERISIDGTTLTGSGIYVECPYSIKEANVEIDGNILSTISLVEGQKSFEWNGDGIYTIQNITGLFLVLDTDTFGESITVLEYTKEDVGYIESEMQTYEMKDNAVLLNNSFTEDEVMEILQEMGENIRNIVYLPSEIDMRGKPHLEAGDSIQVINPNISFQTFISRRTLSGIQSLMDSIENN